MNAQEREKEIRKNMRLLKLTRAEAEQLFEDDHSDEILPEVAEMEKKAKQNCKRYEQADKTKKRTVVRERKVDNEKAELLEIIRQPLEKIVKNLIVKTETEISFNFRENEYTIKLTKHRKKK